MRPLKQKLSGSLLIVVFSIGVAGFAMNRAYTHAGHDSPATGKQVEDPQTTRSLDSIVTRQKSGTSNVIVLPIALRMNGFAPNEITHPAGDFFISVTNLTGLPDISFRLDRENGERLHSAKVPKGKRSWRQHVRLTPGDYVLSVTDLPEWTCRITITPQ